MNNADKCASDNFGIPSIVLMENAGNAIYLNIIELIKTNNFKSIAIFTGPGNNGGDGFVISRKLFLKGYDVSIYSSVKINKLKGDTLTNARICQNIGIKIVEESLEKIPLKIDLIVDALFGININRKIEGLFRKYIEFINSSNKFVVSIDIPSGLDTDLGLPWGICVNADVSYSIGKHKLGLYTETGYKYSKKNTVIDIDIPNNAYSSSNYYVFNDILEESVSKKRNSSDTKVEAGKVVIIAGSPGMSGAMRLSTIAASKAGAGLIYSIVPKSKIDFYDEMVIEAVSIGLEDNKKEYINESNLKDILDICKNKDSVIIGPGLHRDSKSHLIIKELLCNTDLPIIVDATSINHLAENIDILKLAKGRIIITPHIREMARLIKISEKEIDKDRIKYAKKLSNEYGIIVILKGHKTITTDGSVVYINSSGNEGMATAGSGDVLSGILGTTVINCDNMLSACALGVYIHGKAGDKAKEKNGIKSMNSLDIAKNIQIN